MKFLGSRRKFLADRSQNKPTQYLARNLESYNSIIANFPSFNETFDWKRYPKIAARSNFLKHETSKAYAKSSKSCCLGWSEKRSNLADYHQLSELSSRGVLGFTVIPFWSFQLGAQIRIFCLLFIFGAIKALGVLE